MIVLPQRNQVTLLEEVANDDQDPANTLPLTYVDIRVVILQMAQVITT